MAAWAAAPIAAWLHALQCAAEISAQLHGLQHRLQCVAWICSVAACITTCCMGRSTAALVAAPIRAHPHGAQHGCMDCSADCMERIRALLHGLQRRLRGLNHSMAAWAAARLLGTQHCCMEHSTVRCMEHSTAAWIAAQTAWVRAQNVAWNTAQLHGLQHRLHGSEHRTLHGTQHSCKIGRAHV